MTRVAVTHVYTRPCALQTLARPPADGAYLLIDRLSVSQDSVQMELLLQHRDPLRPAHGTRTTIVPMADRATCEAMKKHLDADDKAAHDAVITATADFAAEQAEKAKDREQKACDRVRDDDQHRCADADQLCQTTHDHDRRECDEARQEREALEELQHRPPAPPVRTETRSCEPR